MSGSGGMIRIKPYNEWHMSGTQWHTVPIAADNTRSGYYHPQYKLS